MGVQPLLGTLDRCWSGFNLVFIKNFCSHLYFQNYLVAGGSNGHHLLDSTEVFRDGEWTVVAPLPLALEGVRGVTLDNTVFMTGV